MGGDEEVEVKARLQSLTLPHAGNWLNVAPFISLGLHLRPQEFVLAADYRLGLPLYGEGPAPTCPVCYQPGDRRCTAVRSVTGATIPSTTPSTSTRWRQAKTPDNRCASCCPAGTAGLLTCSSPTSPGGAPGGTRVREKKMWLQTQVFQQKVAAGVRIFSNFCLRRFNMIFCCLHFSGVLKTILIEF